MVLQVVSRARRAVLHTGTGRSKRAVRRLARRPLRALVTLMLDLLVLKPVAIFVWWFSERGNRLVFERRRELRALTERALASGRPVVIASNHVSWFDDPVIPMALFRTGERALAEVLALAVWLAFWWIDPLGLDLPWLRAAAALLGVWGVTRFGAKKHWWTLGDFINLQDASVLRGKLEIVRGRPPGPLLRGLLALADPTIRGFMRSQTVQTIFVDRRPGEEAKRARSRALDEAVRIAARPEPFWIFFEGGRTKQPGTIAPARRGVGALLLALRDRGLQPLLVAVSHRGMERLIPPGGRRFLSFGHRVDVAWAEVELPPDGSDREKDAQALADRIREEVVRLQSGGASQ